MFSALSEGKRAVWLTRGLMGLVLMAALAGCARLDQIQANIKHEAGALQSGDLARDGLVFITPAAPTGQEADRQSVAFLFAGVVKAERPDINVTSLAQTLSAINRTGTVLVRPIEACTRTIRPRGFCPPKRSL